MERKTVGSLSIPNVAMGTWSWGSGGVGGKLIFGNSFSEHDMEPVFSYAISKNLNLWDTAPIYCKGQSESMLGSFMKTSDPQIISTKFTPVLKFRKSAMRKSVEGSLSRLGCESIDLYWIHMPYNVKKWTSELIPLLEEGLIKNVGVSNHNLKQIKQANEILNKAGFKLSAIQNHYSLLYRGCDKSGITEWCKDQNIAFFSYMVLEQGALSGTYTKENHFKRFTRRGMAFPPRKLEKIEPLISTLKEIGISKNLTPAEVAISWATSKGTIPIIGVTKPKHVESAFKASSAELSSEEIQMLEDSADKTKVSAKGFWESNI